MLDFYFSLMSARLFHSQDMDGLKEALAEGEAEPETTTHDG
jgi:hypothetical protein